MNVAMAAFHLSHRATFSIFGFTIQAVTMLIGLYFFWRYWGLDHEEMKRYAKPPVVDHQ